MRELLHKRGFHFQYCNPGGKPLAEEVTGPRVEPPIAKWSCCQMAFHLVTFYTHTPGLLSTLIWEQRSLERCVTCQRAKDRRLGAQPQTIIYINVPTTKAQAAALETYCKNPRVGSSVIHCLLSIPPWTHSSYGYLCKNCTGSNQPGPALYRRVSDNNCREGSFIYFYVSILPAVYMCIVRQ